MLHYGHIRLLERAKALGDYLIVGITADDFDKFRGKINVQQSLMERVEAWCKDNYAILGAVISGLDVLHKYINNKKDLHLFRKSKYSQSVMSDSFVVAKKFLNEGKNVLFSGTPCQIAGLLFF